MNPISLWCSLDESASARGSLFMDDGESLSNIGIDILSFFDSSIFGEHKFVCTHRCSNETTSFDKEQSVAYIYIKFLNLSYNVSSVCTAMLL